MVGEIALYAAAALSALIVSIHLALAVGVLLNRVRDLAVFGSPGTAGAGGSTRASVVIVARDEEARLPRLLDSLAAQSRQDFEIVLVSDRSQDRTLAIMQAFRRRHGDRVKVLENRDTVRHLGPKQYVLDLAVAASSGELLLFTDADCVLPRGWVAGLLSYFRNPRVGVVFGQLSLPDRGGFLQRFQAFDQPLVHQWNAGSAGLGMAGSCFGNNLAARRRFLQELGGFAALGYTLTEDAALVTAAARSGWRVLVSTRQDTMICTFAQETWRDFVAQHLRWNGGGFYHPEFSSRFPYRLITLFLIGSVLAAPFALLWPPLLMLPAASFCSVGTMGLLAGLLYRGDRTRYLLRLVPYTCFFLVFYSWVTALAIFQKPLRWKGERLVPAAARRDSGGRDMGQDKGQDTGQDPGSA
jgi:cellulose synthase/poly-beta-1,6-N-acetylglucosamine synthase-like glycosyltransferase